MQKSVKTVPDWDSLKDKCPKNILPEFRFDSLNGYHE